MNKKNIQIIYILLLMIMMLFVNQLPAQESQSKTQYTLDELKSLMYADNPDVRKAQEEYNRSILDVKDAYAGMGPKIDLQITGTYMFNPPVGPLRVNVDDIINTIQWPSGLKPSSNGQYINVYDGMENTLYNFSVNLQQPIFTWGKLNDAVKLYKQVVNIKQLQLTAIQKQLDTELETRLYSLYYLYQISDILNEEKTYADRLVTYSKDAETSGMLVHQDVLEAQINAKELDIALQSISEQIENLLIELERMTGIDNFNKETINIIPDEEQIYSILKQEKSLSLQKALSNNQESIEILTLLKTVNELSTKIAKNSVYWKPDVALQTSIGYAGSRLPLVEPNWLRKDDYSANLSIGIKTTIWDGGKKLTDVSRKISDTQTSVINMDDARATIKKTFNEQWNTASVCGMRIDYQDLKIQTDQSKIEYQETLKNTGYGSEADLLKAKISWCNSRIERLKQQLNKLSACMTLSYLCGKE